MIGSSSRKYLAFNEHFDKWITAEEVKEALEPYCKEDAHAELYRNPPHIKVLDSKGKRLYAVSGSHGDLVDLYTWFEDKVQLEEARRNLEADGAPSWPVILVDGGKGTVNEVAYSHAQAFLEKVISELPYSSTASVDYSGNTVHLGARRDITVAQFAPYEDPEYVDYDELYCAYTVVLDLEENAKKLHDRLLEKLYAQGS